MAGTNVELFDVISWLRGAKRKEKMMYTDIATNNGEFESKVHLKEADFDNTHGQDMPEIRDWKWLVAPGRPA